MTWEEDHARFDEARRRLPVLAFFGGEIVEDRECVLEIYISRPTGAPSTGGVIVPPRRVRAIIDTGATDSAIRYELAAELGLPTIDLREVDTASSGEKPVLCHTVLVDLLLKDYTGREIVTQHELVAQEMRDDILFGMDLLMGGILTVDLVHRRWDWKYHTMKAPSISPG